MKLSSKPYVEPKRIPAADRWRYELPYGRWTTRDGREVLFNREYIPLWEQPHGGRVRRANPREWVPFAAQEWFFHDGNTPRRDPKTRARCMRILAAWGVHEVRT